MKCYLCYQTPIHLLILSDGTDLAYAYVDFNFDGTLLASVGGSPDHTLTIWNWKEEKPLLRTKAFSQEVFKVTFNPEDDEQLTTSGSGHIKQVAHMIQMLVVYRWDLF